MKKTADVVVIGGGIIGCTTAAELAASGADVVLVERREIAHGASGRNHGLLFYPQNAVTDALYRGSHEKYREVSEQTELQLSLDEKPKGFIILVAAEDQWAPAEAEAEVCSAGGVATQRLEGRALYQAEPYLAPGYLGGWLIEDGYRLDPAALTLAFAAKARRDGAEVRTHEEVKQVLIQNGKVQGVATDLGNVSAATVVDAAGPWAPKVARSAGTDLPLTGARGWLILTRAAAPVANHLLESSGWHLVAGDPGPKPVTVGQYGAGGSSSSGDVGLLIQQNRSGHVLLGGSRLSSLTEEPEGPEVPAEIARRAVAAVPSLAGVAVGAVWSGVRPMSPDGLPLIGPLPGIEGFFVAGGHGGQGIILGAGTGRLAAQMITGVAPFCDPRPFSPGRFPADIGNRHGAG